MAPIAAATTHGPILSNTPITRGLSSYPARLSTDQCSLRQLLITLCLIEPHLDTSWTTHIHDQDVLLWSNDLDLNLLWKNNFRLLAGPCRTPPCFSQILELAGLS